jgi:hypothetical protein
VNRYYFPAWFFFFVSIGVSAGVGDYDCQDLKRQDKVRAGTAREGGLGQVEYRGPREGLCRVLKQATVQPWLPAEATKQMTKKRIRPREPDDPPGSQAGMLLTLNPSGCITLHQFFNFGYRHPVEVA